MGCFVCLFSLYTNFITTFQLVQLLFHQSLTILHFIFSFFHCLEYLLEENGRGLNVSERTSYTFSGSCSGRGHTTAANLEQKNRAALLGGGDGGGAGPM